MRKAVGVLLAAAMVLPVGLVAAPAGAAGYAGGCDGGQGSVTLSPPVPLSGSVTPTATANVQFTNCSGLWDVTSGTAVYTGTATSPADCNPLGTLPDFVGTETITWNTGQTTTVAGMVSNDDDLPPVDLDGTVISGGLFAGATHFEFTGAVGDSLNPGACTSAPLTSETYVARTDALDIGDGFGTLCASPQSCSANKAAAATVAAPGLKVNVSGTPAVGTGTATLAVAPGSLACPGLKKTTVPVATLTDTGFAPTDKLSATATLPLASSTSAEQVCFNSTVPYKSQSSPTVKKAGTAFLLNCTAVANVAPCIMSSTQVGANVVVKFVVPGGDPRFSIVLPKGRQLWASHFAVGKRGQPYDAQLQSSGGIGAVTWTLAAGSGKPPAGCALNPHTGAITGKPTVKGSFPIVVQATDSERPPQTAQIHVPITVS